MKPGHDIAPTLVSISGFENSLPVEDDSIRMALNKELIRHEKCSIDVSAMIIFPFKQWKRRKDSMSYEEFFDWYKKEFFPRLKGRDKRNSRGTYFERMIRYQGTKKQKEIFVPEVKDQLSQIIESWHQGQKQDKKRRPRRSLMQASCFDPPKDHNGSALSGFPCLQQVSFSYDDAGGLSVNAYYPTQYVFDRAYGNYIGLAHLGHFMAHELKLRLVQLNCFIGCAELGHRNKKDLRNLEELIQNAITD